MPKLALFVKVKAKAGKRDELRRLWEENIKPHSEANENQEISFYCFATADEDTICLFELFTDPSVLEEDFQSDWFKAYMEKVQPFLAGPPEVITTTLIWAKGATL